MRTYAYYLLMLAGLLYIPAATGDDLQNLDGQIPSEDTFLHALGGDNPDEAMEQPRMRGIKALPAVNEETPSASTSHVKDHSWVKSRPAARPAAAHPARKSISMGLTFAANSAQLSENSKRVLDGLGRAMQNSRLKDYRFRIEGHTDSIGSAVSNKRLSQLRANSVENYLVDNFSVDQQRLEAVGLGEEMPLNPSNPADPRNRRVRIVNLGRY